MNVRLNSFVHGIACVTLAGGLWAGEPAQFTLKENLNHNWQREPVTFPIGGAALKQAKAGRALCGPDGKAIPYQLIDGATRSQTRLGFQTDISPYETRVYRFTDTPANHATDLTVEETTNSIVLANSVTGIRIAKTLADGQGPIAAVRLSSGVWATGSRLVSDQPIKSYEARVIAHGPVYTEVACKTTIGEGSTWELRIRLYAGEPVVLVDETSAIDGPTTLPQDLKRDFNAWNALQPDDASVTFSLDLKRDFNPDSLLYRLGKSNFAPGGSYGKNSVWKLEPGEVYRLEPWLGWQERERRGNYFGLFREDGNDLLAVAAREAGAWVDPGVPADKRVRPTRTLMQDQRGLHLDFPLKIGQRKWMFITLPKEPSLAGVRDPKFAYQSPPPYQYLIKYGHFPLDLVKDYVLEWDARKEVHPCLVVTPKTLDRYLELTGNSGKTNAFPISAALASTEQAVRMFFEQPNLPYGSAPHMDSLSVIWAILRSDLPLREGNGTPEERQRLRAHLAFLGYTIARPEYWSPERGYKANPNMTTMVAGYRVAAGALLNSHPCARQWLDAGLTELKRELNEWSDDNGGWLEAPHYAMVSYDFILFGFIMAHNSIGDMSLYSPRMRKVAEWAGKISTPPDSRFRGLRHLPPIGNSYINEPTGEFGIFAWLYKDRDPAFSAQMQWLYQQQGSFQGSGIGGSGHSSMAREVLVDPTLPARAPAWGSELFPKTGVILRNVFPSDRETTLYLIAGPNHEHYDFDSGSVTIWGKGRIVADDFGYNGRAQMDQHSMVETPFDFEIMDKQVMDIQEFVPAPRLDYVRGFAGGWTRQISFIKDPDPLAPNYFVIADSLDKPVPSTWRLWCTATNISVSAQRALVVGKEDVDTDVFFLQPQGVAPKSETKTINQTTQLGIIATVTNGAAFNTVIYPRLKNEPAPTFTTLAGGKAVKIEHSKGTDYVFMSAEPFKFSEGDIAFEGTVGAILLRGDKPVLVLGAPGRLSARGQIVTFAKNAH